MEALKTRNTLNDILCRHTYTEPLLHTHTYRVCLIFSVVEVVAVVENVLIGGVETGFDAVLHHLARPGGTLQLLDLNANITKHMVESSSSQ